MQRGHDILASSLCETGDSHVILRLAEPEGGQLLGELICIADGKLDFGVSVIFGDLGDDVPVGGKEPKVSKVIMI